MTRRVAAVVAVAVVVSMFAPAVLAGAVAADDGGDHTATATDTPEPTATATATPEPTEEPTETPAEAESAPTEADGWTLEELRRDGSQPADSPPSVRVSGDRMLWLIHWPARAMWADVGNPSDDAYEFVGEKGPVSDGSVFLRTIRTESGTDDLTLKVVTYRVEERETTAEDGSTTRERVPAGVRERSVDASLGRGWAIEEVSLSNTDEDREVLIYVEGHENDLRWTFSHRPVATQQAAPISTEGDYLWRVAKHVFLPAIGLLFFGGVVSRRAIKNAGKGPGLGFLTWGILLGIVAFFGYVLGPVESTADLLVAAPTLFAVVIGVIATIVFLESYEVRTREVKFVKLDPFTVTSPAAPTDEGRPDADVATDGGEAASRAWKDALYAESSTETIVEMADGTEAVVRNGLFPFLSRALSGCAARLPKAATRNSQLELNGDDEDELVFVSPEFDENDEGDAIKYTAEGWEIDYPEIEDWRDALVPAGTLAAIGVIAAGVWQFDPAFGLGTFVAGLAVWLVRPTEGEAAFEPAPGHLRAAIITAMIMSENVENAETLDDARTKLIQEKSKNQRETERVMDMQDQTIIEEAHRLPVDRAVSRNGNGHGDDPDADLDGDLSALHNAATEEDDR